MAEAVPILAVHDLGVRFGGHAAVVGVSCAFQRGTLTSIVGPNGAGKTTLFNLISGQIPPTTGRILLDGRDITHLGPALRTRLGLGRAFQLTNLFPGLSALDNVRLAVQSTAGIRFDLFSIASRDRRVTADARQWLERVHLGAQAALPAGTLSHGDQRKLEVAILLALKPRVFMFDEPTSGMSVEEVPMIIELIEGIKAEGDKTILLVEHKLDIVQRVADRVVVLQEGGVIADGAPREVVASAAVQNAYLGRGRRLAAAEERANA